MSYPKYYQKLTANSFTAQKANLTDACFEQKIVYNGVSFESPLSGSQVESGSQGLVVCPGGTLSKLTVNFPHSPLHGQVLTLSFTQNVVNLVLSTTHGFAHKSNLTSAKAGNSQTFIFNSSNNKWFKFGGCSCDCCSDTSSPVVAPLVESVVEPVVADETSSSGPF
jgi:hypothetical protein